MAKYMVVLTTTASTFVEVEAPDEETARDESWNHVSASLCNNCSSSVELAGDWDIEYVEEMQ